MCFFFFFFFAIDFMFSEPFWSPSRIRREAHGAVVRPASPHAQPPHRQRPAAGGTFVALEEPTSSPGRSLKVRNLHLGLGGDFLCTPYP